MRLPARKLQTPNPREAMSTGYGGSAAALLVFVVVFFLGRHGDRVGPLFRGERFG